MLKGVGNSTIQGNQIISRGKAAWILPGVGPGDIATLTLDGDWDATGGVDYFVDIADTGSDLIDVTGQASLGGILNVSNAGATLDEGSQFTIVSAPTVSGAFDLGNSSLPALSSGLIWIGLYGEYDPSSPGEEAVLRVSRVGISGDPAVK